MNVSMNRILEKMTIELAKAKQEQNEGKVREHFIAMRTLCDLVLEERQEANEVVYPKSFAQPIQQTPPMTMPMGTSLPSTKMDEDDANGGSLLDF
ncbi:YwdI family protein [Bacillus sp. PS06]|uniref:YwdI family protein n=1 Tax=Bacillus sp. PS06 TaxID=2764176 RepID=UPI00178566C6|nr:YwdI family protein [Bacillus sp. PS06]MBD8070067.1 YwdI family protein [Bacillus sp. PS06]